MRRSSSWARSTRRSTGHRVQTHAVDLRPAQVRPEVLPRQRHGVLEYARLDDPGDLGQHAAPALRERGHPAPLDRRAGPAPAGARGGRQRAAVPAHHGRRDDRARAVGRRPVSTCRRRRPPPRCTRSTTPAWRSTTAPDPASGACSRCSTRPAPPAATPSARSPAASRCAMPGSGCTLTATVTTRPPAGRTSPRPSTSSTRSERAGRVRP